MSPTFGYALFVGLGGLATMGIKRWHERRLGLAQRHPRYRFLWVICLAGAVLGAKLGMLLYVPVSRMVRRDKPAERRE